MRLRNLALSAAIWTFATLSSLQASDVSTNEGIQVAYNYVNSYLMHRNAEEFRNCFTEDMKGRLIRLRPGIHLSEIVERFNPLDGASPLLDKEDFTAYVVEHHFPICRQTRVTSLDFLGRSDHPTIQIVSQQQFEIDGTLLWAEVTDNILMHVTRDENGELKIDYIEHHWSPQKLPEDLNFVRVPHCPQ